ncbi:hypothetical protein J1N35_038126 [Gossypium stocksii]|uniref:RNase H type-1 domain-containing protein n=1 Tax=Gossypium stocksii TaxID=47602 RepID=A0A9D3ZME7_9ROSI|nr:hypothetical protein J1N35_038126 [Gossypium stocksii]
MEFLKNGFSWQIGNGENINIRNDNWGLEGLNGDTPIPNMLSSGDESVKNLWMEHGRCWDNEKVHRLCGANAQTLLHALRDCTTSREVFTIGRWHLNSNMKLYDRCIDWMEDMIRILDKKAMADLITTLWNCWNSRNKFIFKGQADKAQSIWENASKLSNEFRIYNPVNPPILAQIGETKKWERPPKGFIKINFDATVNDNRMGYVVIIRDEDGFVMGVVEVSMKVDVQYKRQSA